MRSLNKLIWTALIAGATASPVFAQGSMSGGSSSSGGSGLSSGGASGSSGSGSSGATLSTLGSTPQITAPSSTSGNTGGATNASNFLTPYYGNPYYQGVLTNSSSNSNSPGGFGVVLFNSANSTGGGAIGSAAGTTTGTTAGRGTTGGKGGGTTSSSTTSGILIPVQVQMSYRCIADSSLAPPPIIPSQLQADLMAMLRRSKDVSNPAAVQISAEASTVTIRGVAKSRDEARTIESMIRMTPGVHAVNNELAYPSK